MSNKEMEPVSVIYEVWGQAQQCQWRLVVVLALHKAGRSESASSRAGRLDGFLVVCCN